MIISPASARAITAPSIASLECLGPTMCVVATSPPPLSVGAFKDEISSASPSTVCSVLTATTVANSPLKALSTAAHTPFEGICASPRGANENVDLWSTVSESVARFVSAIAKAQSKKAPSTQQSEKGRAMESAVASVASGLLFAGCTTSDELVMACVLIRRASRSTSLPRGMALSAANARRVLVAAVRLCAKAHSDEYFSIATMCCAANLPKSAEFIGFMSECEWKLFAALDMNCSVSAEEFAAVSGELGC